MSVKFVTAQCPPLLLLSNPKQHVALSPSENSTQTWKISLYFSLFLKGKCEIKSILHVKTKYNRRSVWKYLRTNDVSGAQIIPICCLYTWHYPLQSSDDSVLKSADLNITSLNREWHGSMLLHFGHTSEMFGKSNASLLGETQ